MSSVPWYRSQWTRRRPLQQTPYLARPDTNIARVATAMHNQAHPPADAPNQGKDKKPHDPLFGPNIGVVSSGPAWTAATEKKVLTDELTPEIVTGWMEKSKDVSQPTTTLQALVNLKRPTIRLSPLSSDEPTPTATDAHHHHHGLEFEYDCDAPKCGIYVHVYLPKDHPDAPASAASSGYSKLLVFESVVPGGFGKLLTLEEGAILELGRFERIPSDSSSTTVNPTPNVATSPGEHLETSLAGDAVTSVNPANTDATAARGNRRRLSHFPFRRRSTSRSVAGPALALVDAEPPTPAIAEATKGKEESTDGIKVTIRLTALDEQGTELASPNEQITYLDVVRFGIQTHTCHEEDTRPWVVKVVKREATIGPHTFHLHEIYGLTSSPTTHTHAPTALLPSSSGPDAHTYPPPATPLFESAEGNDEDPLSECLLCLSSPREVVLLPCRHLVACKDCALNMVEFGAGGNITHAEEPVLGAAGDAAPADAAANDGPGLVTPATPVTPAAARRKRRAKGWFCPVCRQPYTSLLRITTTPPVPTPAPAEEDNKEEFADEALPDNDSNEATRSSGLLPGNLTSSFLRGLSLSTRSPAPDVESQVANPRTGT